MASRTGSRSHKSHHNLSSVRQQANSAGSSTTSSSKQFLETTSADGLSSPASSSARSKPPQQFYSDAAAVELQRPKEDVTVTVRFRPLSPKEIRQGEEIAWYADGDTIVRNEHNPSIAYAYDRVFGPTTTTRHVYDIAAQYVIGGAMEGINGTIFAYGVTSSGKTHTMHGDQRSPGIIPLAVKDAFSIIQETPTREFLLRVSYLEIYNEVVNDLLNPAGQNLRIREDAQGTFVEGIKEEVVLSPAHALSLIAAGHEHRHVGSTNFNIQSSRSHTIFTLTIESSPMEGCEGEAVTLSQLNLIDLAGSESSKAETTGVRRKEGSYINKSLLTLGTVISKLTDGKGSHVPYRDSKLTRLLQSSLGGHGRVSLICTLTPSSSNTEETHNTLKFAHRAKHIEVQAAQNKIIDEKSLIKKYQHEIRCLKEELDHLKRGIVTDPQLKLEEVRLHSRLEKEEETQAALMARIQRLTKLILVSSKSTQASRFSQRPGPRRRHSFGEEELAYLPHKRRDLIWDDENLDLYISVDGNAELPTETFKEEKKTKKNGLLNWLKPRKRDSGMGSLSASEKSSGAKSTSTPSTPQAESVNIRAESRFSLASESTPSAEHLAEAIHDREVAEGNFLAHETPLTSMTSIDQIDLLREQQKILLGEVALHRSSLKRLSEDLTRQPRKERIQDEIEKLNDQIKSKNEQIDLLQKQIADSLLTSDENLEILEETQPLDELVAQLNEKSFELEVKVADNRIIQEQLNERIHECRELEKTVASLKQQLSDALEQQKNAGTGGTDNMKESLALQAQEMEIRELRRKVHQLTEAKEQLELRNQKLAEESSYAKGLASAAAVELKALSEEVAKLMTQNERLTSDLSAQKSSPAQRRNLTPTTRNGRRESLVKPSPPTNELKRELALSREREHSYEAALHEKEEREAELQSIVEESKQREAYLENELANMWVLVAKLRKSQGGGSEESEAAKDEQRSIIDMWNGST